MLLVTLCSTFGLLLGAGMTSRSEAAFHCTFDQRGADDQPGQQDLTQMCRGNAADTMPRPRWKRCV